MNQKKCQIKLQFRQYRIDPSFPIFAFTEGNWPSDNFMRHSSDASCRYMHFHNCLEIGYCYCGGERLSVNDEEHFIFGGDAMMTLPYTPHRSDKFNPHDSDRAYCEYL